MIGGCSDKNETKDSSASTETTSTKNSPEPDAKTAGTEAPKGSVDIKDVKAGSGQVAADGDMVYVLYKGTLAKDGTEFDSNLAPDKAPLVFRLGAGSVIKGWEMGLLGMKVGGERTLRIPAALGYGEKGSAPAIPPNADLVFEVKLLDIVKKGEESIYDRKTLREGSGPGAKNGDTLTVDYVGKLVNGREFDSSYKRKKPLEVKLGAGGVIPGWESGLIGIKKGEKRWLRLPPAVGYGSQGSGDMIPPDSVLIFEIECRNIAPGK